MLLEPKYKKTIPVELDQSSKSFLWLHCDHGRRMASFQNDSNMQAMPYKAERMLCESEVDLIDGFLGAQLLVESQLVLVLGEIIRKYTPASHNHLEGFTCQPRF